MAKDKNSFILYTDLLATVSKLTDNKAGQLFKIILEYVNDKNPEVKDALLQIAFEPIKQQLKRDLKGWEATRSLLSKAGKKGGVKSGETRRSRSQRSEASKNEANEAVTVTVNVNDTVNERENTGPLANSNLFRKPNIPTKQQVLEAIVNSGGDKEMAKSFYEKHDAMGWYLNGSPIVNYVSLASKFVATWKSMEKGNQKTDENFNPLGHLKKLG